MFGLAKIANDNPPLDLNKLYNEAYEPTDYKEHSFGGRFGKKITYKTPVYTPEQEDKQWKFYESGYEDKIIDQFGQQALDTGTYSGPTYDKLFNGSYAFNNETASLVKRYPRLIDAMKQDGRRDRGGILYTFQDNLNAYKDDPEMQDRVYRGLEKQLNNDEFYGWKGHWGSDELKRYVDTPVTLRQMWEEERKR